MSKTSAYETLIKTVNEIAQTAKSNGITHIYMDDMAIDGRSIKVGGRSLINFGSCSYLGLEKDERLVNAGITALKKYGTVYSSSRTYVSCGLYAELEELLYQMYKQPLLVSTNTTLGHYSVFPIVIKSSDAVIFDQQAHISMQEQVYKSNHFGTHFTVLRHNNLDDLETKIKEFRDRYRRIWYVLDGVYSMYGDFPPLKEINALLEKYKQLHVYIDDAHGMSWSGAYGMGYTRSQINHHPRMVMATSLAKGFGACGGLFLFPTEEMRDSVKNWGGPLTYSGPIQPATLAAAVASAKIHLSPEIIELQQALRDRIDYCNHLLEKNKLPLVVDNQAPIFFVGLGITQMGYNMVRRLMNDGFYTNIGIFPAVPETCTGVRFTISNHIRFKDIEGLVQSLTRNLPEALKDERKSKADIYKAFRKFGLKERLSDNNGQRIEEDGKLFLECYKTIKQINKNEWDALFGDKGFFTYKALLWLEDVFSNNDQQWNNWHFLYYFVKNKQGQIILATFFTLTLIKDDLLSNSDVSAKIEEVRSSDPLYLTSKTLLMGCPLSNGQHLFVHTKHPHWEKAIYLLLNDLEKQQEALKASAILLRDFNDDQNQIGEYLTGRSFVKVDMPNSNVVLNEGFESFEAFLEHTFTAKKRYYFKKDILEYSSFFVAEVNTAKPEDLPHLYNLYMNVKNNSLSLNTFALPYKAFEKAITSKDWEVLIIRHKIDSKIVSVTFSYITDAAYNPLIIGLNYSFKEKNIYKISLYHLIKRGIELKKKYIYLGLTANETKKKLGANSLKQIGFIQTKDNFNQLLINSLSF